MKAFALCFPPAEDKKKHRVCLESAGRVPAWTGAWWPQVTGNLEAMQSETTLEYCGGFKNVVQK